MTPKQELDEARRWLEHWRSERMKPMKKQMRRKRKAEYVEFTRHMIQAAMNGVDAAIARMVE